MEATYQRNFSDSSQTETFSWALLVLVGCSHDLKSDGIQEVVGSIPIGSTKQIEKAQLGLFSISAHCDGQVKVPLSLAPDHFFGMASSSLSDLDAAQHARYLFDSLAFLELVDRR
jgi:hypothetical protein